MKTYQAHRATSVSYQLAEGPVWDGVNSRLMWVDIPNGDVHVGQIDGDVIVPVTTHHVDKTVGAVAATGSTDILVAGHHAVHLLSDSGELREIARPIADDQQRRFNDGKCDPAGRFLVGTLALGDDVGESLYRIESDSHTTTIDDDLQMSNGLAWAPDGYTFYSVDTTPGLIHRRPYDPATGRWGPREVAFTVTDGSPDGMCVDTEGNLWLAVWGTGQVRQYTPDGDVIAVVDVDAPFTSCATFAGPDLDRLVITTAIDDLDDDRLARFPASGSLFIADVDARGIPSATWQSPTTHH